jgi:TrwC relaxase
MLNFAKVSAASDGALIRAYMTEDKPEPETLKVHGVALDGRDLETGARLTAYYTGRGERANWRPDMSSKVAAALGVVSARAEPRNGELDALFEARRADNSADWSEHVRKNSGFDFVFAPHKSVSLAAEFAPTEAKRKLILNAIHAASDDALRYASRDLGVARKGHAGEKGSERGEIGWVTFAHDAARPTLAVQNGPDGATYLMDAPIAGDPHYHLHNFIPNLVVTDDGRIGSIDSKALTAHKVHEYGAILQARLADRLRALGVRVGLDADGEAVVVLDIPERAVATFSKRDRQVIGDARRYARENAMDWDELSLERKKQLLHEASAAGRLGKSKDEARSVWRAQAATIGWTPKTVLDAAAPIQRTAVDRHERAYALASQALSAEFHTAAVLDAERLRVHAARGLIEAGATGGREDVDAVVALIEQRGFIHDGNFPSRLSLACMRASCGSATPSSCGSSARSPRNPGSRRATDPTRFPTPRSAARSRPSRRATPASGSRRSRRPPSMRWAAGASSRCSPASRVRQDHAAQAPRRRVARGRTNRRARSNVE